MVKRASDDQEGAVDQYGDKRRPGAFMIPRHRGLKRNKVVTNFPWLRKAPDDKYGAVGH